MGVASVLVACGQTNPQKTDTKSQLQSFSFSADKETEALKMEILDDSTELKEVAGRKMKFRYKTGEGKRLTLAGRDSMFQKYGELQQQFALNRAEGLVDITLMLPTPENIAKAEAEQKKKTDGYIIEWTGKTFPDFEWEDLNGKKYTAKDLKGKITVFNFWFVNCAPCRKEMPMLNRLVKKYASNKNIIFLAPALDDKEKLTKFLEKNSFNYTVMHGKNTSQLLKVSAWPTHMITDKNGVIKYITVGAYDTTEKELIDNIEKIGK